MVTVSHSCKSGIEARLYPFQHDIESVQESGKIGFTHTLGRGMAGLIR